MRLKEECNSVLKKYKVIELVLSILFIIVTILCFVVETNILLFVDCLILMTFLIDLGIEFYIINAYKQVDAYFNLVYKLKKVNDKEKIKELNSSLTKYQRNIIECMKKSK